MATQAAIAGKRNAAMKRVETAMGKIANRFGVDPAEGVRRTSDPALTHAKQLEAFAAWLERLVEAIDERPSDPDSAPFAIADYSAMTVNELKTLAAERGIDGNSNMRKADLIAALEAADRG